MPILGYFCDKVFLAEVFLLELWLQWLDDEEQAARTDDSLNAIFALYALAVADYLCIKTFSKGILTYSP